MFFFFLFSPAHTSKGVLNCWLHIGIPALGTWRIETSYCRKLKDMLTLWPEYVGRVCKCGLIGASLLPVTPITSHYLSLRLGDPFGSEPLRHRRFPLHYTTPTWCPPHSMNTLLTWGRRGWWRRLGLAPTTDYIYQIPHANSWLTGHDSIYCLDYGNHPVQVGGDHVMLLQWMNKTPGYATTRYARFTIPHSEYPTVRSIREGMLDHEASVCHHLRDKN